MDTPQTSKKGIGFGGFLALAYPSALVFEEIPRLILHSTNIWDTPVFVVFFLLEYGIIFSAAYALLRNKPARSVIVFGVIFGILWETFAMHKLNNAGIGTIFAILYGLMFWVPFKVRAVTLGRETVTWRALMTTGALLLLVVAILMPFAPR